MYPGTGGSSSVPAILPITPLTQTTCVLLAPTLVQSAVGRLATAAKRVPLYVEVVEGLLGATQGGCSLVGARMVWLSQTQAQHCLHMLDAGSFALVSSAYKEQVVVNMYIRAGPRSGMTCTNTKTRISNAAHTGRVRLQHGAADS